MDEHDFYSPDDLNNVVSHLGRHALKSVHLNARSVRNKALLLDEFFSQFSFNFSVVMFSETWSKNESDVFRMEGYNTHYLNRPCGRGGGVAVLTLEQMDCELVDAFSIVTPDYEVLSLFADKVLYSVCYRPPSGHVPTFLEFYESFLSFVVESRCMLVAAGDYNIDMGIDTPVCTNFTNILLSNGFNNVINNPTRITTNCQSVLDVFITNFVLSDVKAGALACSISDHLPVFFCLDVASILKHPPAENLYQPVTDAALDAFRKELIQVDWRKVLTLVDADNAYDAFLDIFKGFYQVHFPVKKRQRNRKIRKPWVTYELYQQMRTKDRLFRKFLRTRNLNDLTIFKQYRNKLTKKLCIARKDYFSSFVDVKNAPSALLWDKLNMLLRRGNSRSCMSKLTIKGKDLQGAELADAFNTFFTNMSTPGSSHNACQYMNRRNDRTLFLQPVTVQEVISTIRSLNNSSSRDIDEIQIKPVKYVADVIAPVLTNIFNMCLTTSIFPVKLQVAKVVVLFKKGNRNELGNYRPVSILPIFSKVFEKIIHCRVLNFIETSNVLTPYQFGFRKNMSTELALLHQKEYILTQFENKKIVVGLFVDFSKAFDLVNHEVLLNKLDIYGVRGCALHLLRSYLSHRRQVVQINNSRSQVLPLACGVPQGSILGPLLFNLYINDIVNINQDAKFIIYADDTSIFFSGNNIDQLISSCNDTIVQLQQWSSYNSMTINTNKTKAVIFRAKNKPLLPHADIIFNSRPVDIVDHFKSLGVTFTAHMSWETHVNLLVTNLARITGVIGRLRYILSTKLKLLVYNSLFYSHVNYCQLVWGTTTFSNLQKIYVMQKRYLRHVYNAGYNATTAGFFHRAHVITAHKLYLYRLSTRFKYEVRYNIHNLGTLAYLEKNEQYYATRHGECWKIVAPRLNSGMERLCYSLPSLLNHYLSTNFDLFICSAAKLRSMFTEDE